MIKQRYRVTLTYPIPPKLDEVSQSVMIFATSPEQAFEIAKVYLNYTLGDVTVELIP